MSRSLAAFEGYDERFYEPLTAFEENSFWFEHRMKIILSAYHSYFENSKNFLEVGCGTGMVLSRLNSVYPGTQLNGADILPQGLIEAHQRCPNVFFFQFDALDIPFVDEFDAIGAFDIIEHIVDDECFLSQLHRATKPGGGILLTTPQFPWLWSEEDKLMHHVKRYHRQELLQKVCNSGFTLLSSFSIFGLLLPAMIFKRKILRGNHQSNRSLVEILRIPSWLNRMFSFLCRFEFQMHQQGVRLPFGGSLVLIARKEL